MSAPAGLPLFVKGDIAVCSGCEKKKSPISHLTGLSELLDVKMGKRETVFQRLYGIASGILCDHMLNDYFLKYDILAVI